MLLEFYLGDLFLWRVCGNLHMLSVINLFHLDYYRNNSRSFGVQINYICQLNLLSFSS